MTSTCQVLTLVIFGELFSIDYYDEFVQPRYGQALFTYCFESMFEKQYGFKPEIKEYGKPHRNTFEYCKRALEEKAKAQGIEISKFYMIGDNPSGDIKGANDMGWSTILVKSGKFTPTEGQTNDEKHPADHVVEGFA